ncbi:hypothetical protein Lalb_Chr14g0375761 [Lupinus albus]|uniref:Uncharacterized protein n=1 Tax=Lupinus albus TaxID=3870 RepID=A0A6A4PGU2_LUPAL|nr:hypothetical protein Lalb_Chr14g0375761 [Lupinus albus]
MKDTNFDLQTPFNVIFLTFSFSSTTMMAMIKSNMMEIIMHFLDFFCKLLAVWRASFPTLT